MAHSYACYTRPFDVEGPAQGPVAETRRASGLRVGLISELNDALELLMAGTQVEGGSWGRPSQAGALRRWESPGGGGGGCLFLKEGRGASLRSPGVLETTLCLCVNGDAVLKIYF